MNTSWNHDGLLCLLTISDSNILRNSSTQPVGMSLAELRSTMNGEPETKLFHFSAIAFVLGFVVRAVRKGRSKMFEVADNSVIGRYAAVSRPSTTVDRAFWVLQLLLAAVFLIAGTTKLAGAQMPVETFEKLGVGQWFRYFTGSIEVIAAIMIIVPRTAVVGATLLAATMVGAIDTHVFLIGGSPVPALVLLVLTALVVWYRGLYR
jgi:putative oxidoreductase